MVIRNFPQDDDIHKYIYLQKHTIYKYEFRIYILIYAYDK